MAHTLRYLLARFVLSRPGYVSRNTFKWARWHGVPKRERWWRKLR